METIELEKGWLIRQMVEVRQKSGNWPDVMQPLMTLNDSLIHPSTAPDRHPEENSVKLNLQSDVAT